MWRSQRDRERVGVLVEVGSLRRDHKYHGKGLERAAGPCDVGQIPSLAHFLALDKISRHSESLRFSISYSRRESSQPS